MNVEHTRLTELLAASEATRADLVNTIKELRAEVERLKGFAEEVRDYKPEIHSGRMSDPQDDVPDVIEADVFLTFQEDATAALEAKT